MNTKYIFDEYTDYNLCEDCGINSNQIYSVYEDGKEDSYFLSGGMANCYGNEYPSLIDIHNYCITILKFNVDINIDSISTLNELVDEYIKNGISCSYNYDEASHEQLYDNLVDDELNYNGDM